MLIRHNEKISTQTYVIYFALLCHQLNVNSLSRIPNYTKNYSTYAMSGPRSYAFVCFSAISHRTKCILTSLLCVHLINSGDSGKLMMIQVKLTVEPASMYKSGPPRIFVMGSVIGSEQTSRTE